MIHTGTVRILPADAAIASAITDSSTEEASLTGLALGTAQAMPLVALHVDEIRTDDVQVDIPLLGGDGGRLHVGEEPSHDHHHHPGAYSLRTRIACCSRAAVAAR